jgi:ABC-type Fe3+-siderophore transport system permease subunit
MMFSPIIIYALLGAFLALVLMYLDTKIGDNPKTKSTYLKGMAASGIITAFIIWLAGVDTLPGFGSKYLPAVDDEIFTGMPDF